MTTGKFYDLVQKIVKKTGKLLRFIASVCLTIGISLIVAEIVFSSSCIPNNTIFLAIDILFFSLSISIVIGAMSGSNPRANAMRFIFGTILILIGIGLVLVTDKLTSGREENQRVEELKEQGERHPEFKESCDDKLSIDFAEGE